MLLLPGKKHQGYLLLLSVQNTGTDFMGIKEAL